MNYLKILLTIVLLTGYISAQDSVFVTIDNDTVNIWNTGAFENCAFNVEMESIISNDSIKIIEHDTTTILAYCMCYFDMCATITGLNAGNYHVEVYRTYDIINDPDSLYYIGSTDFTFSGMTAPLSKSYYQSDCYDITYMGIPEEIPKDFVILQNYPNPFNPKTSIFYSIPFQGFVNLTVYNLLGQKIATLINKNQKIGSYEIKFDGTLESSGIYFSKLTIDGKLIKTIKMILMK